MSEKEKYLSIYNGALGDLYNKLDPRGRQDGGYGRACWGEGMLDFLKQRQAASLLDVGCGYGRFCDAASRFVPHVYGLDIASVATGNVIENPAIRFIDGEAKSIPLADQAVEWLTSFDCLEHCLEQDIDTILEEFNRVAAKGFVVSISYDPDYCMGVPLHMTVRPEQWWIDKLSRYGRVTKTGRVPITGAPYLVCEKSAAKKLICYCVGGLGNRLRPLSSCAALARITHRELAVLWRPDDFRCQAGFNELFDTPLRIINDEGLPLSGTVKIYADPNDVEYEYQLNGKDRLKRLVQKHGCYDRNHVLLNDEEETVVFYHNNFIQSLPPEENHAFLFSLRPHKLLRDRVDQLLREMEIDSTVIGVHARGTDFDVSVDSYGDIIQQTLNANPSARFLVCSDDPLYEKQLKQRFAEHVIVRAKKDSVQKKDASKNWTNNTLASKASILEAIVDIYLLAHTDFRIFNTGSTYAQIAKLLSLNPAKTGPPPRQMPDHLRGRYTMNGRIRVEHMYFDESKRDHNNTYSRAYIDRFVDLARQRRSCNYGDTDQWLHQALDLYPIQGKTVLVIGSQVPFYEGVCIARGAAPVTVEFEKIRTDHPDMRTLTVKEYEENHYQFDAAICISTFEHTGLGRYGDPLDPDGDLKAMLTLRTKVKQGGIVFLSVPTGKDAVVWNAHRVYGDIRLAHLLSGWELQNTLGEHDRNGTYGKLTYYQPVYVLKNNIEQDLDLLADLFCRYAADVFVETGTALGRGVKAALKAGCKTIYSVERDSRLYAFNKNQFKDRPEVHILNGDSEAVLPELLKKIDTPATFWLDAHRTGGGLDGGRSPYPLLNEIACIKKHATRLHTLLIDDRRLFETEFGITESKLKEAILAIDPGYRFKTHSSTPATVGYGQNDILAAIAPSSPVPSRNRTQRLKPMKQRTGRILYYCPDINLSSAGIRRLYRHVRILVQNGFDAAIMHHKKGFSLTETSCVPVLCLETEQMNADDIVVIPEGHPHVMHMLKNMSCRLFAIALNWDYIFKTLPDGMDWRQFNIERVLVVSPFIGNMISWCMKLPIHLLDTSIDPNRYYYDPTLKKAEICYIKRKAPTIQPLMRLLSARNPAYTSKLVWRPLEGLSEEAYAEQIRTASFFLNLSPAEGFPTSCMEAMAAGAIVAGYDAIGGRDYLHGRGDRQNCILAPNGDYVSLAYALTPVLDDLLCNRIDRWDLLIDNGRRGALKLTPDAETRSLIDFWGSMTGSVATPGTATAANEASIPTL